MMSEGEKSLSRKHIGLAFCGPLAQPYRGAPCEAPSICLTAPVSFLSLQTFTLDQSWS